MTPRQRDRFDEILSGVLDELPPKVRALLDEVPVVALDVPTPDMLRDLGMDPGDREAALELCGLHTGTADTERSVEHSGDLPSEIHLFREGIVDLAGGWVPQGDETAEDVEAAIREEVRITLLHEIGHQFGLDEDDLTRLGYE